jgi:hypothetical protein
MISSLLHILIVTPVIFAWLRERRLHKELQAAEALAAGERSVDAGAV